MQRHLYSAGQELSPSISDDSLSDKRVMPFNEQLSTGDVVFLTATGAKEHRTHHTVQATAVVAAATAVTAGAAAPIAAGGAIGLAGAFGGVGVSSAGLGAAGAAAGGAAGGMAGAVSTVFGGFPEAGFQGTIINKRQRWFGQPGHDYEVKWQDGTTSWHLSKHLQRMIPPSSNSN